jgi:hypothetical protein
MNEPPSILRVVSFNSLVSSKNGKGICLGRDAIHCALAVY